jgi:hypothetical protein
VIERIVRRAKVPSLATEGIAVFSRYQFNSTSILVPSKSKRRWGKIVETSAHSLNAKHEGSGRQSARDSPVCWFFLKKPCRVLV